METYGIFAARRLNSSFNFQAQERLVCASNHIITSLGMIDIFLFLFDFLMVVLDILIFLIKMQ